MKNIESGRKETFFVKWISLFDEYISMALETGDSEIFLIEWQFAHFSSQELGIVLEETETK